MHRIKLLGKKIKWGKREEEEKRNGRIGEKEEERGMGSEREENRKGREKGRMKG